MMPENFGHQSTLNSHLIQWSLKNQRKKMSYVYIGIVILFVIALLVVGFVMDKEDIKEE